MHYYGSFFFKDPTQFEKPQLLYFVLNLQFVKGYLVTRLVPYQKSWNTKAIKYMVIEPQLYELLNVQWLTYLP